MKNKSKLARTLLLRYLIIAGTLLAIGIALPFLARIILSSRIWYADDFLYPFLNWAYNHLIPLLFGVVILIWILITVLILWRAVGYLDEALQATQQLVTKPEQTIQLSPELTELEAELNHIREDSLFHQRAAQEAEQRKNDLIVYLAHDLRTPLTSIIGYLTLLEEMPELPLSQRAKYLHITLDKAYRLENLINEFFEITRFNLSSISLVKEKTDLSMMVEQITYEFTPVLSQKNLSWQLDLTKQISLALDREKFERVLDNLIRNAISYAAPDSAIKVTLSHIGGNAYLEFENQGPTIPPDKLKRIFEPFYRADSARGTEAGGTGLGLPIAKEIVEGHGGTLTATSEDNTFRLQLTLPLSYTLAESSSEEVTADH